MDKQMIDINRVIELATIHAREEYEPNGSAGYLVIAVDKLRQLLDAEDCA